jgi:ribonuclease HII
MSVLGIDEAGRGSVLGPLVVTGFVVSDYQQPLLSRVKDSKQLTPKQRLSLFNTIKGAFKSVVFSAKKINELMERGFSLNDIELMAIVKIMEHFSHLPLKRVIIDCPHPQPSRFLQSLSSFVSVENVVAEHKADEKYVEVSMASVVAKVLRDRFLNEIAQITHVNVGSGYPSDRHTVNALKQHFDVVKPFARLKWKTVVRLCNSTLDTFSV